MTGISNHEDWASEDNIPDPDKLPRIFGRKILVRPISPPKTLGTKGLILAPTQTQKDMAYLAGVGRVVALGPQAYHYEDGTPFREGPWCKVGDIVTWPRLAGKRIVYKNVKFISLMDEQIEFGIDDPKDIDMAYNLSYH